jgi:hypothetical protein
MSELQEFTDQQELEYIAAVTDIKNAIEKFGPEVLLEALQLCNNISNVLYHEQDMEEDSDLTNVVIPDTMYVQ